MSQTSAIYHRKDSNLRAINVSGKWQLQRRDETKGTREHDPWYNIGFRRDTPPNWPS